MLPITKLKEMSFLVYGLGTTGRSVVKFLKKNKVKNYKIWDDRQKYFPKNKKITNLKETLNKVDYIVLSPGISLIKKKNLIKFKKKNHHRY